MEHSACQEPCVRAIGQDNADVAKTARADADIEEGEKLTVVNACWSQRIVDAMGCLGDEFRENELAYLALTSKVENPIRDRLAYSLHRAFGEGRDLCFAREWTMPGNMKKAKGKRGGRLDLTIFQNEVPRLFLELKSMYSFDMYTRYADRQYPEQVGNDMTKMNNYNSSHEIQKIAIILITDPVQKPEKCLDHIIKYSRWIRQFHEETKEGLEKAVECNFSDFESLASGFIDGGRAFGIDVTVRYWCFDSCKRVAAC